MILVIVLVPDVPALVTVNLSSKLVSSLFSPLLEDGRGEGGGEMFFYVNIANVDLR